MSDVVIKAEHLSKYYNLGVINNGTLFRDIQTWWALKRGKEDPHSQIGSHKYDTTKEGFWALKDLNFEIHQGDRVGIIGKNGAGKSTLLKILSRITAPTEGKVKIKGRVASLLEVGTGFHAELTGRENIYLNGAILGMKRREVDRKIDEIIAFSEIENHIDTPVKRYSSGMYVRLAFAVAAHLDSEILIADEVLAVGDAAFQKKALGKMNDLSTGEGRTVLFVSHQMNAVKSLCNTGIILDHGRIVKENENIDRCINWYLSNGKESDNNTKTSSWENKGDFTNTFFCPTKLYVTDEKGKIVTSALKYDNNYNVILEVDVEKQHPQVDYWITISKGAETISYLPMDIKRVLKKGHNILTWKLPAGVLCPNPYNLSVGSSIRESGWILDPSRFEISIQTEIVSKKTTFEKNIILH
ncbi:MAG: ABC transporter ATP-binding protein [Treponema sp.]|nr:ABC transporter ATP-binding protein [Treponema sp.]